MKEGWRYEKLDDLGTIVTGATPSTNDESNYFPKEYCFVKPSDLPLNGVGSIHETENYVSSKGLSVSRPLPAGSVLTTCIGTIGKVGLLLQEGCTNQQINAVIPNNKINSRYLAYALLSIRKQLEFIANAPVVPIINKKCFSKIHIGYPPKPTQLSIVSELDKINELIRIKKEQLKDYDTLAQSIFYEMFGDPVVNEKGWEMKTLGHICEITSSKRVFANEYVDTGVPFYRSKEVIEKSKQLPISVELYISESHYNKIKSSFGVPQIGDILVTAVGTIGKIWVVDTNEPFYFKDGNLVWLRNIKGAHCEYFRYSLFYLIDEYKKVNANGAAYNALTIAKLKLMLCPLPPLSLQQSFAQKIEQIEQQKAAIQKTITDLETLLAARMQYWFD
ncbi:restriction endonuclease subunit S [Prevotella melaninogenica]|jgi:restriction endonuclease, S subunit|uniref:restriction endonuclease subunit S n=1 Tax=Prevotella melaninogenica TaxID=28132 RepID=UPI00241F67B7|nr:restriction endonuclease subunit S [Prevotella melaninogenica]